MSLFKTLEQYVDYAVKMSSGETLCPTLLGQEGGKIPLLFDGDPAPTVGDYFQVVSSWDEYVELQCQQSVWK